MHPFPGHDWLVIAEPVDVPDHDRRWWKLAAVEAWLDRNSRIGWLAWCDDHLQGGRREAVRRRLNARGIQSLVVAPDPEVGLTPAHMDQLEAWATTPPA